MKKRNFAEALNDLRDDIHNLCVDFEKKHGERDDSDTQRLTVTGDIFRGGVVLRVSMETAQS